jgi:hypothetical protein
LEAFVDIEDLHTLIGLNYRWYANYHKHINDYYVHTNIYIRDEYGKRKNTNTKIQTVILNLKDSEIVDHINHKTLDNRRYNLRVTPNNKNLKNRNGKNSNNKSGYRNVSWDNWYKKWKVQLQVDGKNTVLDMFEDVHEAGKYAEEMRNKYYGSYAGKS